MFAVLNLLSCQFTNTHVRLNSSGSISLHTVTVLVVYDPQCTNLYKKEIGADIYLLHDVLCSTN